MLNKNDKQVQWFEEARLGMFIHWGICAATEGYHDGKETNGIVEWIQSRERIPGSVYEKYAEKLSDKNFDTEKIADLAKNAGMKYLVFTTKHHEGFSMYDTKVDDYSINKRSGVKRDILKDLVESVRKRGIVPCFYYSQSMDFHEENAWGNTWDFETPEEERDFDLYFNTKCKPQIKELLTNYGPIGVIWFDVPRGMKEKHVKELYAFVKSIQPDCLVNGRIGGGKDDWDFICMGDNEAPYGRMNYPAETCATMNNTWGYKRDDKNFKSPKTIIELLCQLMSKGVNLLLNIGPRPDGSVPEESLEILGKMAEWMDENSEAVYKTQASPFCADFSWGWISRKENNLYLLIREERECITIAGLENEILSAKSMKGEEVKVKKEDGIYSLDLSNITFNDTVTVVKLELDGEAKTSGKLIQQEKDYISLQCCDCKIHNMSQGNSSQSFDSALDRVLGEYRDVAPQFSVNINGTVEKWYSTDDYISWEAEDVLPGEYDVYLYTVTGKYRPWCGGHKVSLTADGQTLLATLTEKVIGHGVNRQYFAETGSLLGSVKVEEKKKVTFELKADYINEEDKAGLSVTRLVLVKK